MVLPFGKSFLFFCFSVCLCKILFILDDGRLKATLTDGDVRRWILSGGDLSEPISKVANYRPFYLKKEDQHKANEIMKKYGIEAMPIVDEEERLLSLIHI